VIILEFHSNFPLHLSVPPISSMCSATHHPLLGFFSHLHRDELSTPPFDFSFRGAHDRLFFLVAVIHLVCFYIVYFPIILVGFSFWCNFYIVLFPYNRFLFLLVIMLGLRSICSSDALRVCCFSPDLWVVDVNVILAFKSRMMSFGLGFSALSAEE
jgi:hypothetical protein